MRAILGLLKTLFILVLIAGVIYLGVNFGVPKVKALLGQAKVKAEVSPDATPETPAPQKPGIDASEVSKGIINALAEIEKSEALTPITRKTTFPIISPDKPISVCYGVLWIVIAILLLRFGLPKILGLLFGGVGSGIDSLKDNIGQRMTLLTILVPLLLLAGVSELMKIIGGQPLFAPELSKGIVAVIGLILAIIDSKGRTSGQWNNTSSAWKNIWTSQTIEFPTKTLTFLFHAFVMPIFIAAQLAVADVFLVFLTGFSVTAEIIKSFGGQQFSGQIDSANIPIFSWVLGVFTWFSSGSLNFSAAASQRVNQTTGTAQLAIIFGLVVLLMIFKFGRRGTASSQYSAGFQ